MRIGKFEVVKGVCGKNIRIWSRYLIPKRLTLKHNPPIYRWIIWHFGWDKIK